MKKISTESRIYAKNACLLIIKLTTILAVLQSFIIFSNKTFAIQTDTSKETHLAKINAEIDTKTTPSATGRISAQHTQSTDTSPLEAAEAPAPAHSSASASNSTGSPTSNSTVSPASNSIASASSTLTSSAVTSNSPTSPASSTSHASDSSTPKSPTQSAPKSPASPTPASQHTLSANSSTKTITNDDSDTNFLQNTTDLIEKIQTKIHNISSDTSLSKEQQKKQIVQLFAHYMDLDHMAKLAIIKYWNTFSKNEQDEYIKAYKAYMINHYVPEISKIQEAKVSITSTKKVGNNGYIVFTKLSLNNDSTQSTNNNHNQINIAYRCKVTNSTIRIIDLYIENMSLIKNQRKEMYALIEKNGIKSLIDSIKK